MLAGRAADERCDAGAHERVVADEVGRAPVGELDVVDVGEVPVAHPDPADFGVGLVHDDPLATVVADIERPAPSNQAMAGLPLYVTTSASPTGCRGVVLRVEPHELAVVVVDHHPGVVGPRWERCREQVPRRSAGGGMVDLHGGRPEVGTGGERRRAHGDSGTVPSPQPEPRLRGAGDVGVDRLAGQGAVPASHRELVAVGCAARTGTGVVTRTVSPAANGRLGVNVTPLPSGSATRRPACSPLLLPTAWTDLTRGGRHAPDAQPRPGRRGGRSGCGDGDGRAARRP